MTETNRQKLAEALFRTRYMSPSASMGAIELAVDTIIDSEIASKAGGLMQENARLRNAIVDLVKDTLPKEGVIISMRGLSTGTDRGKVG